MTTRQIGFIVIGFLLLTSGSLLASEQPGPSGSVGRPGGGSGGPSGKGGIPEGQTPVEPMGQGTEMNNPPEPNSGKGTQNPKQQTGKKGEPHASEEAKEKK